MLGSTWIVPQAPQSVLERVLDLGAVERAFARQVLKLATGRAQALCQGVFRTVPAFLTADALFGACGQLVDDVRETKVLVDLLQQRGKRHHL